MMNNMKELKTIREQIKNYVVMYGDIGLKQYIEDSLGAVDVTVIVTKDSKILVSYIYKDIPSTEIYDLPVEFLIDDMKREISELKTVLKISLPVVLAGVIGSIVMII